MKDSKNIKQEIVVYKTADGMNLPVKTDRKNGTIVDFRSIIHIVRDRQVVLDKDLAALYGVETGALNRAVKRNAERFPEDFMFQLTEDECLICQIGISKKGRGGTRYRPYAFTEHDVAMLSGVLHSETAVRVNIEIMRAFVAMRKTLSVVIPEVVSLSARVEANERRQIADQAKNDEKFDLVFQKLGEGDIPDHKIFFQGQFWDAKSLLVKLVRRAKKDLVLIDAYLDVATLDILSKRNRGVKIEIFSPSNGKLAETDFEALGHQCGKLTKSICGICHDRYLIVDNKELYTIGASLKDAGRLTFSINKSGPEPIAGLLENLHNATSACKVYE